MSNENTTRSAFRSVSVTETEMAHQASIISLYADQFLGLLTLQNNLAVRLAGNISKIKQDLPSKQANNAPCLSIGNKTAQNRPKVQSVYRDLILQEKNSTDSTQDKQVCSSKHTMQIISGTSCASKITPFSKAKEENYSQSFNRQVQQKSEKKQSKASIKLKKKQTQTKNMVKNFSKSIFSFIKKNKELRQMVLRFFAIDDQEFMKVIGQFKGQINSIAELRQLWIEGGNNYDKVFRILSHHYLRRGCFERTFNSRVQNYRVHLKYRKVLLEGLQAPQQFTVMKTNQFA